MFGPRYPRCGWVVRSLARWHSRNSCARHARLHTHRHHQDDLLGRCLHDHTTRRASTSQRQVCSACSPCAATLRRWRAICGLRVEKRPGRLGRIQGCATCSSTAAASSVLMRYRGSPVEHADIYIPAGRSDYHRLLGRHSQGAWSREVRRHRVGGGVRALLMRLPCSILSPSTGRELTDTPLHTRITAAPVVHDRARATRVLADLAQRCGSEPELAALGPHSPRPPSPTCSPASSAPRPISPA